MRPRNEILESLALEVPETNDWSNLPWRHDSNERAFTDTQRKEINLFRKQGRFTQAKKERYIAYQERLQELQYCFENAEAEFEWNNVNPFTLSIWESDIEETRKRTVPAYTFDRFLDLPKELQFMIWSKTIEVGEKQTHILMCMTAEYDNINDHRKDVHNPPGSTSIFRPYYSGYGPSLSKGPDVLKKVSHDACRAYLNVYSHMPCRMGDRGTLDTHLYNTWSDEYYLGEREWTDFKILIDMVIMQNTTRPINESVARDVAHLQTIRHLTVDLNIFGGAPANIWRHFWRLATLTIAFYPYTKIQDRDRSTLTGRDPYEDSLDTDCTLVFAKPRRNKKFVKRAEVILNLALESLKVVALEFPSWKVPRIEVVVKKSGNEELDQDAEHPCDEVKNDEMDEEDDPTNIDTSVFNNEVEEDDSAYLDQLPLRMSHPPLSVEQIKRWKHRYHPSRERTSEDALMSGRTKQDADGKREWSSLTPSYFADSEGESDVEREYRTVDDGEPAGY